MISEFCCFSHCLVPAVVVVRLQLEALVVVVVVELEVVEVDRTARAVGARRWRGGVRSFTAALAQRYGPVTFRLERARHQTTVDDRVRLALPFEARSPDRRVDGVCGLLLGVEVADGARLAVRVVIIRLPPPLALAPRPSLTLDSVRPRLRPTTRRNPILDGPVCTKHNSILA